MGTAKAKRLAKGSLNTPMKESDKIRPELDIASSNSESSTALHSLASASDIMIGNEVPETQSVIAAPLSEDPATFDFIEIRSTDSKGQAVFATRKIKPGTLIIREKPIIRLTQVEEDEDKAATEVSILETRFKELSRPVQKAYLKLFDSEKSDFSRVKSIYYSNCYNLSDANRPCKSSPGGSAIGMVASRINHSCLPNVQFSFDETTAEMLFRAIKPIPRGKEIVSNYNSVFDLRASRQRTQMLYYGFMCDCEACEANTDFWAKSDERRRGMIEARREIKNCDKAFEEHGKIRAGADPMYALERLESLMIKEGLIGMTLADTYRSMSKWAERKSDMRAAKLWKSKELAICKTCLGEKSPRTGLVKAKIESYT